MHPIPHDPDDLSCYDYVLPPEAIAQRPAEPRDASRLLVLRRPPEGETSGRLEVEHSHFASLPEHLARGDLLILNDTRVIPARLTGRKLPGGGVAEVLLVRREAPDIWQALVRCRGRKRAGLVIDLGAGFRVELTDPVDGPTWRVRAAGPAPLEARIEEAGHVPLPPYIRRPDDEADRARYQTVFARRPGAVAAPTAGLHFTRTLLERTSGCGIGVAYVTLHVGPGTFRPLDPDEVARGELHAEPYELPAETAAAIGRARGSGGRVIAVGTTTMRVLETCADPEGRVAAGSGETRLFIRPPYRMRVVDGLVTNFHLPRSSLLMLVSAFAGRDRVLAAYREALRAGYRFYSYGDAMLIL